MFQRFELAYGLLLPLPTFISCKNLWVFWSLKNTQRNGKAQKVSEFDIMSARKK